MIRWKISYLCNTCPRPYPRLTDTRAAPSQSLDQFKLCTRIRWVDLTSSPTVSPSRNQAVTLLSGADKRLRRGGYTTGGGGGVVPKLFSSPIATISPLYAGSGGSWTAKNKSVDSTSEWHRKNTGKVKKNLNSLKQMNFLNWKIITHYKHSHLSTWR